MAAPTETYTAILTAEVQPNAPVTADLASRWRANLLACLEGAAGAQRLYLGALERVAAGATQRAIDTAVYSDTATLAFVTLWEFGVIQGGSLRFGGQCRSPGGGTATLRIQRVRANAATNSVIVSTSSTSYVTGSVDVNVLPGDLLRFQHDHPSSSIDSTNLTVSTSGADLFPAMGAFGKINANTALT